MKKVIAGGCFNKIHKGHIYFLNKAKELGYLIVVLTNDKNNKKPYAVLAKERKKRLTALKIADKIVIGHANDFSRIVKREKPQIIALGYDQKLPKGIKIKTKRIKKYGNYGTRKIL